MGLADRLGGNRTPPVWSDYLHRYNRHRCIHIPGFLSSDVVMALRAQLEDGHWTQDTQTSDNFRFDRYPAGPVVEQLTDHVLTLAPLVRELEPESEVAEFRGQLKRLMAGPEYRFPWHSDKSLGRVIGVSLCLQAVDGGAFELRKKWEKAPLVRLDSIQAGDVHIFDVQDSTLVHRVSPILSPGARVFFAGWFYSRSDSPHDA